MRKGYSYSALMHAFLLLLAYIGLPEWFEKEMEPQPLVISLEQLPISEMTNVKPSSRPVSPIQKKQPPKAPPTPPKPMTSPPPPPPPPAPIPTPVSKPQPPVPEPEIKRPEPIKKITRPEPIKRTDPKKPEPKVTKEKPTPPKEKKPTPPKPTPPKPPKPKTPKPPSKTSEKTTESTEQSMDEILKNIEHEAQTSDEEPTKPVDAKAAVSNPTQSNAPYDASRPLSMSVQDSIRSQLQPCWNLPAGAPDPQSLSVTVHVSFNPDGSVKGDVALDSKHQARYNSDNMFRSAAESAVRAVKKCSPLKLPADSYDSWKTLRFTFDPSQALGAW